MILTQILQPKCIKLPLDSLDKDSAIKELVELLNQNGLLKDCQSVLEAVMVREKTRSTGIGSGIAIPHGKCSGVEDLVMAVGLAKEAIDYDSIDNKPVRIIILLVSPLDRTGPHIQALARISKLLLDNTFKQKLEAAESAEQVYSMISERENQP